ncbi:MAG: hypothetical protein P4L84_27490, partial [Isosphaeraceae bacterium]|nr:hypothetical protein [Isosphaeraceae bacterium]
LPVGSIFFRAFQHGFGAAWDAVTTPDALHALWLTFVVALIAVPLNTVFGVGVSLILAPEGPIPLDDDEGLRAYFARYVVPGIARLAAS